MSDITIIGGGIIGLLSAREFAISGATVTLIERGYIGRESSWAGGGILLPLYPWRQPEAITTLCLWSNQQYPTLANTLFEETGTNPEWIKSGMLIAAKPNFESIQTWCKKNAIALELLTSMEAQKLEPNLASISGKFWRLPDIAQIRNPRLIRALRLDLEKRGVRIIENQDVRRLVIRNNRVLEVDTRGSKHPARHVVVTAGAWTQKVFHPLFPQISIQPVKGQMLLFSATPGFIQHILLDGDHYLIPRKDGKILAGSTVEHTGFDKSTTQDAGTRLKAFALAVTPALANRDIEKHWAGLRPGSPGGIPYIDNHPIIQNLSINSGHFRNGFVMGPASARLIADLVLNRQPVIPPEPYALSAFREET